MIQRTTFLFLLLAGISLQAQKSYFQQEVNYTIRVTLDDVNHELKGDEQIEYINNSPDRLNFIWMHIWPNAYKNNHTALGKQLLANGSTRFQRAKEEERGYIDGLQFKVNGQDVEVVQHPQWIDVCQIFLTRPMEPGERIMISTPFHVKIPVGEFSRMGHIEQQYQITQWYPKPAVYDKFGWHPMPYLDQGEFYSEYGSFDVSITVPENYVLGATGDLVDGEKETEWLNKLSEECKQKKFDEKLILPNGKEVMKYTDEFPPSSPITKTLRFRQSRVHDFAWFCDKRYNVLKGEVELPHSKRKMNTWLMFTNGQSKLWKAAVPYINDAIYYYSKWNGDYPYNHATAVDGALSAGGGMEYPNITVIGEMNNAFLLETVIMHEVGHNWFYGILGSNERDHPWMDEGLNSFNENRYVETKYPKAGILGEMDAAWYLKLLKLDDVLHKEQYYMSYIIGCKLRHDQPVEELSANYTPFNYGGIVYSKTAIVFDYLMAWLGEETMDKAMQLYFETWKFKHPYPEDLRKILEQVSGKDLSWFFNDVLTTTKRIDFKITNIEHPESNEMPISPTKVSVKNTGEITAPVTVYGFDKGDTVGVSLGWSEPIPPGASHIFSTSKGFHHFRIDPLLDIPEYNRNNNSIRNQGFLRKSEKPQLVLFGSLDAPDRSQLFYTPIVGWNYYDGVMAGMAVYNSILPRKKLEFTLAPMYGFRSKKLAGMGEVKLNFYPKKVFQTISLSGNAKKFTYDSPFGYRSFTHKLFLEFRNRSARSPLSHQITLSDHRIFIEGFKSNTLGFLPVSDTTVVQRFTYQFRAPHAVHGWNTGIVAEYSADHTKLMWKGNFSYHLLRLKRVMELRLNAGVFLSENGSAADKYSFRLNNGTGSQDYLFSDLFLGRSEQDGFLSRQIGPENGNFMYNTSIGVNKEWIASAHFTSGIPFIPFLKIYASLGMIPTQTLTNLSSTQYEAGVYVPVANDAIRVYLPLLFSKDIQAQIDAEGIKTTELIRFSLDLNRINPLEQLRNLDF